MDDDNFNHSIPPLPPPPPPLGGPLESRIGPPPNPPPGGPPGAGAEPPSRGVLHWLHACKTSELYEQNPNFWNDMDFQVIESIG